LKGKKKKKRKIIVKTEARGMKEEKIERKKEKEQK
jgi:hypothetical protein